MSLVSKEKQSMKFYREIKCPTCGGMNVMSSRKIGKHIFCSPKCMAQWYEWNDYILKNFSVGQDNNT